MHEWNGDVHEEKCQMTFFGRIMNCSCIQSLEEEKKHIHVDVKIDILSVNNQLKSQNYLVSWIQAQHVRTYREINSIEEIRKYILK